ncbi:MAG: hypothetical protein BGO09_04630 [Bacteroidetes bacterium 47-18]|nr:MAG: hypothetical protein BGO09_04630 [Bacteroidetes bacterium 47-18]
MITVKAEAILHKMAQDQKDIIASRNRQILAVEKKLATLEELLLSRKIDGDTYNRLYNKLIEDKDIFTSSRQEAVKESEQWIHLHSLLSSLKSLKDIYKLATLAQKHILLQKLLLHNLIYESGNFKLY